MSVECLWDECYVFAASTKLDQPASRQPLRQVRGLGSRRGYWADRGRECARACASLESRVCACTSDLLSLPAQEEEGTWLPVLVLNVGPVCRYC